jgi:hypothetical protein
MERKGMRHTPTRHLQHPSAPLHQALAVALVLLGPAPVWADNPLSLTISQSLTYDNNVLRSDRQKQRDLVSDTSVQVALAKSYGRQNYQFSAQADAQRYKNSTNIDNDGYAISAAVSSEIAKNGFASLDYSRSLSLQDFEQQGNVREKEQITVSSIGLSGRYGLGGWWALTGGVSHSDLKYKINSRSDRTSDSYRVGLRYNFTDLLYLEGGLNHSKSKVPGVRVLTISPITSGFVLQTGQEIKRSDLSLSGGWQVTGFSSLSGRVGWSDESYSPNKDNGYKGLTWSASWGFTPRGKLSYNLLFSRDTNNTDSLVPLTVSFFNQTFTLPNSARLARVNTLVAGSVSWQATAKISASLGLRLNHIAEQQSDDAFGDADKSTADYRSLSLSARYAPIRNLSLGCALSAYSRPETNTSLGYSGETVACSASYAIDP